MRDHNRVYLLITEATQMSFMHWSFWCCHQRWWNSFRNPSFSFGQALVVLTKQMFSEW